MDGTKGKYEGDFWTIPTLAKFIHENQKGESDWSTLVTGRKGVGKSTLAYKVAQNADARFELKRNIIMTASAEGISDRLEALEADSVVSIDESIGALFSENWAKEEQKGLHMYLAQCQRKDKHTAIFFCLPHVKELRGPLRRSGINMWIRIYARGEAAIMLPSAFEEDDPLRLNEIVEVRRMLEKETGLKKTFQQYRPEFQRAVYRRLSTYLATIKFPEMTPPEKLNYEDYFRSMRMELKKGAFGDGAHKANDDKSKLLIPKENTIIVGGEPKEPTPKAPTVSFCGCVWQEGKRLSYCKGHAKLLKKCLKGAVKDGGAELSE